MYSEARQNLSKVLDTAKAEGKVIIRRADGSEFNITPVKQKSAKIKWPGVQTGLTRVQILSALREVRERKK
jgi:antitoxin (DNA-binding transcriptional repressor) of toxin-antitoxin stability system